MIGPPTVSIVLPLEGSLQIRIDAVTDSEEARLVQWLCAHDDLLALVGRAFEIADRAAATRSLSAEGRG